jgi:hypothetical protein
VQLKRQAIHNSTPQQHPWVQRLPPQVQAVLNMDHSFFHLFLDLYTSIDPDYEDWWCWQLWGVPNTHLPVPLNMDLVIIQINHTTRNMFWVYPDAAWRASGYIA